jgi:enamine deaminase RidA (YjgF/YER057c/UK114 family)
MTVYISDMSKFSELNRVYSEFFTINPPPRVTVETSLPFNRKVQIDCLVSRNPKSTLHVQGISYWAPANIGPYSQAVLSNGTMFSAGQIGLIPSSMKLSDGIVAETNLSLSHVGKVIEAMMPRASIDDHNLVYATCYIADIKYASFVRDCWRERYGVLVPLCVVALSGLPRGASVEWCVVCGEGDVMEYSHVDEDWGLEVVKRGGTLGALSIVKNASIGGSSLREKLKYAVDEVKWEIKDSLMFARVFYARGVSLNTAKEMAAISLKGLIQARTFVAVDGIKGGDLAFLIHGSSGLDKSQEISG